MATDPSIPAPPEAETGAAPIEPPIEPATEQMMSEFYELYPEEEPPVDERTVIVESILRPKCPRCVTFRDNCVHYLNALTDLAPRIHSLEALKPENALLKKQNADLTNQLEESIQLEQTLKARVAAAEEETLKVKEALESLEKNYDIMVKAAEEGKKHAHEASVWRVKYEKTLDVCEKIQEKRKKQSTDFDKMLDLAEGYKKELDLTKSKVRQEREQQAQWAEAVRMYIPSLYGLLKNIMEHSSFKTEFSSKIQAEAARLCSSDIKRALKIPLHYDEEDDVAGMSADLERLLSAGQSNERRSPAVERPHKSVLNIPTESHPATPASAGPNTAVDFVLSELNEDEADDLLALGAEAATMPPANVAARGSGQKTRGRGGRRGRGSKQVHTPTFAASVDHEELDRRYNELLVSKLGRGNKDGSEPCGSGVKHMSIHGKKTLSIREQQEAQMKCSIKEKVALMKKLEVSRNKAEETLDDDAEPSLEKVSEAPQASDAIPQKNQNASPKKADFALARNDLLLSASPSPASSAIEGETGGRQEDDAIDTVDLLALEELGIVYQEGVPTNPEGEKKQTAFMVLEEPLATRLESSPENKTAEDGRLLEDADLELVNEVPIDTCDQPQSESVGKETLNRIDVVTLNTTDEISEKPVDIQSNVDEDVVAVTKKTIAATTKKTPSVSPSCSSEVPIELPTEAVPQEAVCEELEEATVVEDSSSLKMTPKESKSGEQSCALEELQAAVEIEEEIIPNIEEMKGEKGRESEPMQSSTEESSSTFNNDHPKQVLVKPPKPHLAKDTRRALGLMRRLEVDLEKKVEPIPGFCEKLKRTSNERQQLHCESIQKNAEVTDVSEGSSFEGEPSSGDVPSCQGGAAEKGRGIAPLPLLDPSIIAKDHEEAMKLHAQLNLPSLRTRKETDHGSHDSTAPAVPSKGETSLKDRDKRKKSSQTDVSSIKNSPNTESVQRTETKPSSIKESLVMKTSDFDDFTGSILDLAYKNAVALPAEQIPLKTVPSKLQPGAIPNEVNPKSPTASSSSTLEESKESNTVASRGNRLSQDSAASDRKLPFGRRSSISYSLETKETSFMAARSPQGESSDVRSEANIAMTSTDSSKATKCGFTGEAKNARGRARTCFSPAASSATSRRSTRARSDEKTKQTLCQQNDGPGCPDLESAGNSSVDSTIASPALSRSSAPRDTDKKDVLFSSERKPEEKSKSIISEPRTTRSAARRSMESIMSPKSQHSPVTVSRKMSDKKDEKDVKVGTSAPHDSLETKLEKEKEEDRAKTARGPRKRVFQNVEALPVSATPLSTKRLKNMSAQLQENSTRSSRTRKTVDFTNTRAETPDDGPPSRVKSRVGPIAPRKRGARGELPVEKPASSADSLSHASTDDEDRLCVVDEEEVEKSQKSVEKPDPPSVDDDDERLVIDSEEEEEESKSIAKEAEAETDAAEENSKINKRKARTPKVTKERTEDGKVSTPEARHLPSSNENPSSASGPSLAQTTRRDGTGTLQAARRSAPNRSAGPAAMQKFSSRIAKQLQKGGGIVTRSKRTQSCATNPQEKYGKEEQASSSTPTTSMKSPKINAGAAIKSMVDTEKTDATQMSASTRRGTKRKLDESSGERDTVTKKAALLENVLQKKLHGALMSEQKIEVIRKNLAESVEEIANMDPKEFAATMVKCSLNLPSGDMWTIVQANYRSSESREIRNKKEDSFVHIANELSRNPQIWVEYVKKMVTTMTMQSPNVVNTTRYIRLLSQALYQAGDLLTNKEKRKYLRAILSRIFLDDISIAIKATTYALLSPASEWLDWMNDKKDPFLLLLSVAVTSLQKTAATLLEKCSHSSSPWLADSILNDGKILLWAWFQRFPEELQLQDVSSENLRRAFDEIMKRLDEVAAKRGLYKEKECQLVEVAEDENDVMNTALAYFSPGSDNIIAVKAVVDGCFSDCVNRIKVALNPRRTEDEEALRTEAFVVSNRLRLCIHLALKAIVSRDNSSLSRDFCAFLQEGLGEIRDLRDKLAKLEVEKPWVEVYRSVVRDVLTLIQTLSQYEL